MPEPFPQPAVERPRVWWSPTEGVIEETARRWHDEESRTVRTRDRHDVAIPDDAVELLVVSADVREVLVYVSRGRGYVDVEPYPDFEARRALGALRITEAQELPEYPTPAPGTPTICWNRDER